MQLNDAEITYRCETTSMVIPFENTKTTSGHLSYGLGHFGYDIRLGHELQIPVANGIQLDPSILGGLDGQQFDVADMDTYNGYVLYPGDFVLAGTFEQFNIPSDIVAVVHDKSTLARIGIAVQNTVLEPGWSGYLTVEISNHGKNPVRLSSQMPIAQVIFFEGNPPDNLYDGKYQNQIQGEIAK